MYQFSRAVYRELCPMVEPDCHGCAREPRRQLLDSCERAFTRLATDRHYFAMARQMEVYRVVDRYMNVAAEYVVQREREGLSIDGSPLCCHASTRKGTPCQRVPLPGSKYCPSHKHLEEGFGALDDDEFLDGDLAVTAA
jgi:hypothetical protein